MHTDRLTAFELKRNHETAAVEGVDVRLLCFVVLNQRLLKEREPNSDGLHPRSDGLHPSSDGLQSNSDGLQE